MSAQRAVVRAALAAAGAPAGDADMVAAVDALWARPGREHRYVACQLACRYAAKASPG